MTQPEIVIIGLGYIGLPTATLLASKKTNVLGVDINSKIVETINRGEVHIVEPELDKAVYSAVKDGYLRASIKAVQADTYIIVVPTPFKAKNEADISYVEAATKSIIPLLKKGDLYIIESTSPVGTTEKMMRLIYGERPELSGHLNIAYCPERVLPGNVMYELVNNDRVIGGINEESTEKAILFYSKYIKGELHKTNASTAEMCKLVENSSRDVQIAFANELSIICDKAKINVWELIKLANKHPRVNILNPGSGVGGHCIAVDPYFIVSEYPMESKIIKSARNVNDYKSFWCVEKIQSEKLKFELEHGRKPKTALMGLAFKQNIDDLRESPATYITQKVLQNSYNEEHFVVEPNITSHDIYKLTDYKVAIEKADIIVYLVAHDEFINEKVSNKIILDFAGVKK
ncbi:MAG: UDP-N-acetyl-D-mannosaminuronic acid dehydrogenase [Flavobacteriaceae bacterium]|jgi:UDP-N-acetyl-D-mannosaminuronic acid dehydrogenase